MSLVFSSAISAIIGRLLKGTNAHVDQSQSNSLFGVHQLRVRLPGDPTTYRLIVAPADAPVFIGGSPADGHFLEPLVDSDKKDKQHD